MKAETINQAIQILTTLRTAAEISLLKNTLVRQQDFDNAGKIRDVEKLLLSKINDVDYKIVEQFLNNLEKRTLEELAK